MIFHDTQLRAGREVDDHADAAQVVVHLPANLGAFRHVEHLVVHGRGDPQTALAGAVDQQDAAVLAMDGPLGDQRIDQGLTDSRVPRHHG